MRTTPQAFTPDSAALRYLDAASVRCPAGSLSDFRVCTEDAQLGMVEGVLVDRFRGRVAYLVIVSRERLATRRYLLPIDAGAIVTGEPNTLRVEGCRADLRLQMFRPQSVPRLAQDDLSATRAA